MAVTRDWRGEQRMRSYCLMHVEYSFLKMKRVVDWLYNNVNALNATELYT